MLGLPREEAPDASTAKHINNTHLLAAPSPTHHIKARHGNALRLGIIPRVINEVVNECDQWARYDGRLVEGRETDPIRCEGGGSKDGGGTESQRRVFTTNEAMVSAS